MFAVRTACSLVCILIFATTAQAQTYPDRPVKVIVPYTAGGGTDTVGRAISQRLSEKWGQPVIVENRAGAGTSLDADAVAKSHPTATRCCSPTARPSSSTRTFTTSCRSTH